MRRWSFVLALLIILMCISGFRIFADQFHTSPLTEEDIVEFVQARDFQWIEVPIETGDINCFDVSPNGWIALGINSSPYAVVNIYDFSGQFLYGYKFLNRGMFMTLFFEGENLSIYFGRANLIGTFDRQGECVLLREVAQTKWNDSVLNEISHRSTNGTIGGYSYYLDGGSILKELSWSRFVLTDSNGTDTIIYDVSKDHTVLSFVGSIIVIFALMIIWKKNRTPK